VAARTTRISLVTGAVLPIFNHPIKLAGELAMLDCISHGRLVAGFARAFLPEEFDAFERSMDESRARFEHGLDAVIKLWTQDDVIHQDPFYHFGPISMLSRPVQKPHPPVLIAAIGSPQSFEWAGKKGYHLMVVPYLSKFDGLQENLRLYRETFAQAHPDKKPRPVQMSFHLHVAETDSQAYDEARPHLDQYLRLFRESAGAWANRSSSNYPGYRELIGELDRMTFERGLAETRVFIGSPDSVERQMRHILELFGDIEPSLSMLYGNMPLEMAERSLRLFATEVMPRFGQALGIQARAAEVVS
jgi:alkanesulfonate monooxygenase SsuD/methylene tetrahydromethanopterin reductase-like flavin-dependent oxidoreductase (luciferase family)